MHIRPTQVNPYAALDALRSAQRAAAKREAELVRGELLEAASELAGESDLSDACAVRLEQRQESERQSKRRKQQDEPNRQKPNEDANPEEVENHVSDWA